MAVKTKKSLNKQRKTMKKLRKQKKQRGGEGLLQGATEFFNSAAAKVKEGATNLGEGVKGVAGKVKEGAKSGLDSVRNTIAPSQSGGAGAADHAIKVYGDIGQQGPVSATDNTILTKDPSAMKLAVQAGGVKRKNQKEMYEEMEKLFKQKQGNKVLKNLRQLVKQKGGKKVLGKFLNEN
tara:strand:- start:1056 stop:1592 length:537 start_codon:yes stop_codon:yes gene_type:complete